MTATATSSPARAPLATPWFRALWIATVISNIGTWMHDVGAAWLMTSLSPSPMMVALVQAATTLPIFLLALPSGALADIVDRRRMLITAQLLGLAAAAGLAIVTTLGLTTPWVLLGFTFMLGIAAAASAPVFQAIVPELVDRRVLPDAIAVNSLAVNIARAIGPALGGVIVAIAGSQAVFALNAVSVLAVVAVLARWRREPKVASLPPERFFSAVRAGVRYARRSPALQIVLIRTAGFIIFASATWAMLPLIARHALGLGAGGYGALLAIMGAGAVAGAFGLPRLRARFSPNRISVVSALLFGAAGVALAVNRSIPVAGAAVFVAGGAWIATVSALNVAAQLASPAWVKARALALYLVIFQGAMAAGSIIWGATATRSSVEMALVVAGIGLVLSLGLAMRFRLPGSSGDDLTPSSHWPDPALAQTVADDRGPVMVTIAYRVAPERVTEFARAMRGLRRIRLRDGAIRWDLFEDAAEPGLMMEAFVVESWLEHERQHQRVTEADRIEQEEISRFHMGASPPEVRHLLTPPRSA